MAKDKSKNCQSNPNLELASYKECDEQYMRDICDSLNVAPVWLYDDYEKVTRRIISNISGEI